MAKFILLKFYTYTTTILKANFSEKPFVRIQSKLSENTYIALVALVKISQSKSKSKLIFDIFKCIQDFLGPLPNFSFSIIVTFEWCSFCDHVLK